LNAARDDDSNGYVLIVQHLLAILTKQRRG
jgi:hypothetical protein